VNKNITDAVSEAIMIFFIIFLHWVLILSGRFGFDINAGDIGQPVPAISTT
jgi:hypothetical protein